MKIENIRDVAFRIGIQKEGELTKLSKDHFCLALEADCPIYKSDSRQLFSIFNTKIGPIGVFFVRNTDLCKMVANGYLDAGIIGTDIIEELGCVNKVAKIRTLDGREWPFVYATPSDQPVPIERTRTIGSSYPNITRRILKERNNSRVQIVEVRGSVEALPYIPIGKRFIDGVTDICVTGTTMKVNGLIVDPEPLTLFKPVLVANFISLKNAGKRSFFDHL